MPYVLNSALWRKKNMASRKHLLEQYKEALAEFQAKVDAAEQISLHFGPSNPRPPQRGTFPRNRLREKREPETKGGLTP